MARRLASWPRASSRPDAQPGSRRRRATRPARSISGRDECLDRRDAAGELEGHDGAEAGLLTPCDLVPGVRRQAWEVDLATCGCCASQVRELERIARMHREARVQRAQPPQRQEAIEGRAGEPQTVGPPAELLVQLRRPAITAPPTTSLWPLMYLVVECTTRSAPSLSGCCQAGDRKVLSTTTSAPAALPSIATAAISVSRSSGLLGVSTHSIAAGLAARAAAPHHRRN